MNHPTIDVLLPTYNCESYIQEALTSLYEQTHPIQNIYILDDASTDCTLQRVTEIHRPHVHILHSERSLGIVHQLNKGIALATATYIARMDGDDICHPNRLTEQVRFLETHPDHVACSGAYLEIDKDGQLLQEATPQNLVNAPNRIPAQQQFLKHPFLLTRTTDLKHIGGYHHIHHCEDADLYYRLSRHGKLYNLPQQLGKYRIHLGSISSSSSTINKLQALHSQLTSLSYHRAGKYDYPEELALALHTYFIKAEPSLEDALAYARTLYTLTEPEYDWLHLAFPVKYLQNSRKRELKLSPKDITLTLSLMPVLQRQKSTCKHKALRTITRALTPHFHLLTVQQKTLFIARSVIHKIQYLIYYLFQNITPKI